MINRLSSWSIRTHMVILLCLLALPCMILIVRSGMSERRQAIEEAKRERLRFVDTVASEQQSLVAGAEQLATALALVPDVRTRDAEAAGTLFSELLKANPQFSNISVADKTGVVWASAVPIRGTVNVADRRSFREAVRTGKFSSGEYSIGRLVKKPVINFGYPVKDKSGGILAVISVAFDLNRVEKMFEKLGPAPGTTFSMLDHQGTIIIRRPKDSFSSRLDGQRDISETVFPRMNEGPDEGAFETLGNDGEPRFFVYRKIRLPQESKPYLYIRSTVPLASVISRANAAMLQNLAMLFVICGVGVALVWSIGKRVIVNPVLGLTKASEQLSAGAGAVKVSGAVTGGELGQLARAFDNMAGALTEREKALRESEERYRLLVETANEGIWSMDGDQVTTYVNQAMADMLGSTPSGMIGRRVDEYFFPEDMSFHETRMRIRRSGGDEVYERRFKRPDGSVLWTLVSAKALRDGEGKFAGSFAMFTDITGIKRSEEALRLSEERFRLSQAVASAGTWEWDLRTNENIWSDELWPLYGLEPHSCEASYESWLKTIHPDDREKSVNAVQKAANEGEELNAEWRVVHPDGTIRWLMSRGGPLRDAAGRVVRFVGIVIDITARRVAEEGLRTSERRYRALFDEATEGIALADHETGILQDLNKAFLSMTGYDRSDLVGRPQTVLHPPEDGNPSMSRTFMLHRLQKGGVLSDLLLTRDGRIREVEIKTDTVIVDGVKLMQGFFRDVTEERMIQREKEAGLTLLRLLNEQGDTRELIHSLAGFLQGWTGCGSVGIRLREGDDFPYYETRGFSPEFVEAENCICAKDSGNRILRDAEGNPVLECVCGNILSGKFDAALPFFTENGSFWTNSTTALLATTTEEDLGARIRGRCIAEGFESVALIPLKYRGEILGLLQLDDREKGRFTPELISFLESTCEQITIALAQRRAQAALKASEQRFRDVSEAAGEFIFEVDAEGCLIFISDRVQDVLEYNPKEITGKMFFDLLPEADTTRIKSLFGEHIRARSAVRDLEHQALTRSGSTIWLNIATVPIFDDKDNFLGFRGAAMNVTARKEAEKNIRSSLKEKEVLLKEIHHRVKNNLQVISSLLRMQSQYVHDPGDADSFRASIDRIKSMALIHDKLYRSGTLASIALPDYVNDLVSGLHSTYSLETPVEMDVHISPPFLGIDDAVPVGLILNELISNSLKHAFPGKDSGTIRIHIGENGGNHITLIVSDNGVGIPADLDFTNTPSLGMQLVVTLVEQLDGTIELNRDRGTEFRITFTAGG